MEEKKSERLPFITKLLYGAGDFGFATTDAIIGVLFAIFMTDVVGLSPELAALAIFIGRTWDYINDPLFGYISDRTRSRWGRRRPFLLFGILPFALTFIALWWVPPFGQDWMLVAYYAIFYLLYDASATLVYMPYYALTPELTQDYDERTSLTSYRMVFSVFGGLLAFIVPLMIIGSVRPENANKVLLMAVLFGTLSAMPLLGTFFATRERKEFMDEKKSSLWESLRSALRNRTFLFTAGIFLFTFTALEMVQGMLLYFVKYRLNLESSSDLIAGSVFVCALFSIPLWNFISKKFNKRTAYIIGMIFFSAVLLLLIFLDPAWFPNSNSLLIAVICVAVFAGIGFGSVQVLPWAMVPDAMEEDELRSGTRHEGMFYSLILLLRKVAPSLALPLMLLALGRSGYVANALSQTPSAVTMIRILMGVVPGVLMLFGVFFAIFYPMTREKHARLRQQLEARRKKAGS